MHPFKILINNTPIQLGAQLPEVITHLNITCLMRIVIPRAQAPQVRAWLNAIIERLALNVEYVEYNGVLVNVKDIRIFE